MWRKLLWIGAGCLAVLGLLVVGIIFSIRSGLQRFSDEAMAQFPGDRVEALMRLVDCDGCALANRNHAVWALGQMSEERASPVLRKHFDGRPCTHASRLCQYELRKAIRRIDTRDERTGPVSLFVAQWHRPWHQ